MCFYLKKSLEFFGLLCLYIYSFITLVYILSLTILSFLSFYYYFYTLLAVFYCTWGLFVCLLHYGLTLCCLTATERMTSISQKMCGRLPLFGWVREMRKNGRICFIFAHVCQIQYLMAYRSQTVIEGDVCEAVKIINIGQFLNQIFITMMAVGVLGMHAVIMACSGAWNNEETYDPENKDDLFGGIEMRIN